MAPQSALAINCRVWVFGANFGIYMPARPNPLDISALMLVRCVGQPGSFTVSMGPGLSGDQMNRTMFSGATNTLSYNIFRNAARTQIWGDGTPPTVLQSGVRNGRGRPSWFFFRFFGRAYANQTPNSGFYDDNIVVTVLF